MSRPTEPEKKQALLEQCLAAAIEAGVLDSSINTIAKRVGTSARMLIYHFGSKQELEQQLIGLLEIRLREKLWSFQETSLEGGDCLAEPLLEMWSHLTSPDMCGLLKLTMELNQRAIQGDAETQRFIEQESRMWIDSLFQFTKNKTMALSLFHLFQGAILDFLTTGNAQRGQQTIEAFTKTLREL
ncbi:MAG: TetR/AcrR family transcriptional regulator [Cyanobacteria bacterium P01_D01_bin.105]